MENLENSENCRDGCELMKSGGDPSVGGRSMNSIRYRTTGQTSDHNLKSLNFGSPRNVFNIFLIFLYRTSGQTSDHQEKKIVSTFLDQI